MPETRVRDLKAEELSIEIQDGIILKKKQGVPIKEIQEWLKSEYDYDITDKSLMRFFNKNIDLKLNTTTKQNLGTSFNDAIDNVRELNSVNETGLRILKEMDATDKEWFNNLNILSRSCMDAFKTQYALMGQKDTKEPIPKSTEEEELERAIQSVKADK